MYKPTPLNKNYESCNKCFVEFIIDLKEKTNHSVDILKQDNLNFKESGKYSLSSDGVIASKDLRHHLNFILKKLEPLKENIQLLKNKDINCYISCVWFSYGHGGPVIWPEQALLISQLSLDCYFHFIYANNRIILTEKDRLSSDTEDCHTEFLIYPDDESLDLNKLTKILMIQPVELNIAGTEIINSLGKKRIIKKSSWILSSEKEVSSIELSDHIEWLLKKLLRISPNLKKLDDENIMAFIKYILYSSENHKCIVIKQQLMRLMAVFDLEYAFDIYFDDFL